MRNTDYSEASFKGSFHELENHIKRELVFEQENHERGRCELVNAEQHKRWQAKTSDSQMCIGSTARSRYYR